MTWEPGQISQCQLMLKERCIIRNGELIFVNSIECDIVFRTLRNQSGCKCFIHTSAAL